MSVPFQRHDETSRSSKSYSVPRVPCLRTVHVNHFDIDVLQEFMRTSPLSRGSLGLGVLRQVEDHPEIGLWTISVGFRKVLLYKMLFLISLQGGSTTTVFLVLVIFIESDTGK